MWTPRPSLPVREAADQGGSAGLTRSDRGTWPSGDGAALTTLGAVILVAVGLRWIYDDWLSQWDIFTFFLPNYGYVGDRIRSFEFPPGTRTSPMGLRWRVMLAADGCICR